MTTIIEFSTLNFEYLIRNQYHTSAFEVGTRLGLTDCVTPRNYRSIDLVFKNICLLFIKIKWQALFYLTLPAFMGLGPVRRTYKHCSEPKDQLSDRNFSAYQRPRKLKYHYLESEVWRSTNSATTRSNNIIRNTVLFCNSYRKDRCYRSSGRDHC